MWVCIEESGWKIVQGKEKKSDLSSVQYLDRLYLEEAKPSSGKVSTERLNVSKTKLMKQSGQ